jgi:hypothetical protein
VERSFDDPGLVITTYEGTHIHVSPGTAGSSTSSSNINSSSRDNVYAAGSEDYRIPSSQINFSGAAASTLAPAAAQNNNNNNNIYDLAVQIREQILGPAHHHHHPPPLRPPPPPPQAHPPSSNIHISQTSSDHLLRELQEAMVWGPRANTGSNSGLMITGGQQSSQDRRIHHHMASSSHLIFTNNSHEDLLEDMLRPSSDDDLQDPTHSSQFHHHFRELEQD